jgi:SAM-dependent methyltransferase
MTNSNTDWKQPLLAAMRGWREEEGIAVSPEPLMPEAGYRDIDYESILRDPYRTVTAEHPFYEKTVLAALQRIASVQTPLIADLGCGDGRFVRWLLNAGQKRVVAMDISRPNLRRLRERLRALPSGAERVLLVEGDIASPPLPKASVDLAMAVGVLLVLNERYAAGVRACAQLVRPGGYLLTFDPTDYGAAMYAIARHDLGELQKVVDLKTKTVDIADANAPRYSVRSAEEMVAAHKAAGLEVVSVTGIPLFPSLLFGAVKQLRPHTAEQLAEMKRLNDALVARFPDQWRVACVLSQRQ